MIKEQTANGSGHTHLHLHGQLFSFVSDCYQSMNLIHQYLGLKKYYILQSNCFVNHQRITFNVDWITSFGVFAFIQYGPIKFYCIIRYGKR